METNKVFRTNKLFLMALQYLDEIQSPQEITEIDLTETFFDELIKIAENKELINITINGS